VPVFYLAVAADILSVQQQFQTKQPNYGLIALAMS